MIKFIKKSFKAIYNQTVFSQEDFWEWTPSEIKIPSTKILIDTPTEMTAEEYEKAGGAKGEVERNKKKYLEMHNPDADKAFNDMMDKAYDKFHTAYCKPFDWVESKLPKIK